MFTVVSDSLSAQHTISDGLSRHLIVVEIHVYLRLLQQAGKAVKLCWVPSHFGIAGNERADAKACEIVEHGSYRANHKLPHHDFCPSIRKTLHAEWNVSWKDQQHNKLVLSRILLLLGQRLTSVIGGLKSFCADSALATPGLHTYPCSRERNIHCVKDALCSLSYAIFL